MATAATLTADDTGSVNRSDRAKRGQSTHGLRRRQSSMPKKKAKSGRGGRRPGAGGKPIHGVNMAMVGVRATPDQRARWEAAAEAAGMSLSEWIRQTLDTAAGE